MIVIYENSCVAVYEEPLQAQQALQTLQRRDFDTKHLSLLARAGQSGPHAIGLYAQADQIQFQGGQSSFWKAMWQRLPGAALFWIPRMGVIVVAGPLGLTLAVASEETVSGVNILRRVFYNAGIPNDSIVVYENALIQGHYLLLVQAEQAEVEQAHELLRDSAVRDMAIHLS